MNVKILVSLVVISILGQVVIAGPSAYAICQAGCACPSVACYSAAGATFGTVLAAGAPAAILACNSAFGSCQAACAAAFILPTP